MDFVGTAMGLATIPMALLTLASLVGGIALALGGHGSLVLVGIVGFGMGLAIAAVMERGSTLLDEAAWRSLCRHGRSTARPLAILAGAVPVALILAWELSWFRHLVATTGGVWVWLWTYGIATGPWTVYALAIHGDRRTLCGIRAYAGHIAYWLLSATALGFGTSLPIALIAMLLPAILPFVVGMLLAVADREALRNVRI